MKKAVIYSLFIIYFACASQYSLLFNQASSEANKLAQYCKTKGIQSPTITKADSLYSASSQLMQKGHEQQGYYLMDQALVSYRLVLAHDHIKKSNKRILALEKSLVKITNELNEINKLLGDLESIEK